MVEIRDTQVSVAMRCTEVPCASTRELCTTDHDSWALIEVTQG